MYQPQSPTSTTGSSDDIENSCRNMPQYPHVSYTCAALAFSRVLRAPLNTYACRHRCLPISASTELDSPKSASTRLGNHMQHMHLVEDVVRFRVSVDKPCASTWVAMANLTGLRGCRRVKHLSLPCRVHLGNLDHV